MAELEIFKNDEFGEVRTAIIEGKPYFCGSDVAKALGYTNPQKAIRDHCKLEGITNRSVGVVTGNKIDGKSAVQNVDMKFITEGNVYRLIARSKLPQAEKFESWVFDEVVPSVREKGYYSVNEQIHEVPNIPIGDLASFLRIERTVMKDNGKTPQEIAEAFKLVTDQFCVNVPENFIDDKYTQLQFF